MKKCSTCNLTKSVQEFYKKENKHNSLCKACFNSYCVNRWVHRKIEAIKYKGGKCANCALCYPAEPYFIFDFHHLNPREKEVQWTKLRLRSWEAICAELDKCTLLCSNCHRKAHYSLAGLPGFEPGLKA